MVSAKSSIWRKGLFVVSQQGDEVLGDLAIPMYRGAIFDSSEGWCHYRYGLWRIWDHSKGQLNVIGLNPSTATAELDDPTIRKCMRFAQIWGFGGLVMTNIFAYRATDPAVMKAQGRDAIGIRNDEELCRHAAEAKMVLAAWGAHGCHLDRGREVYKMLHENQSVGGPRPMRCFRTTKDGHPYHPLYEPYARKPVEFKYEEKP